MISWGAVLYDVAAAEFHVAPLRENIPIADRTGGGDSFTSGVLAALLQGKDLQTAVEFGAAHGMLVQEMVRGGSEVMIGVSEDTQFGPTVAFGLGGIFVEVLKDISLRVAPLSTLDAEQMIREIKGYPILQGVRGQKRSDIAGIVDVLMRISRLAHDWKDVISEIDINPLIVFDEGRGVKAADALVVLK